MLHGFIHNLEESGRCKLLIQHFANISEYKDKERAKGNMPYNIQ